MNRRTFVKSASLAGASLLASSPLSSFAEDHQNASARNVRVWTNQVSRNLPHTWEECIGSDRAIVATRAQWQQDLELVKRSVGVKSVRFHGLFNDEMGVWQSGNQPSFLYVDSVFDAMLDLGIKPFVELSFMPAHLASGSKTIFFYRGNTTPPAKMAQWGELVSALGKHCVERYGINEVASWNFEVWNEPNIVFWSGTKDQYFELYRRSATALKGVDKRLRVGGPSSAQAAWVGDLLTFCSEQQVPIDFASSHIYPDDSQKAVFGEDAHYPYEQVISRALEKMQSEIAQSKLPRTPLYITEWSSQNPAFIADTIKRTVGLADILSYWTFDNVFEELGVPRLFMNNSFGLLGMRGVPRPSYHAFTLLHRLGDVELKSDSDAVLATRRKDGSVAVLLWNLVPKGPGRQEHMGDPFVQSGDLYSSSGTDLHIKLSLDGRHRYRGGRLTRVDGNHGNLVREYQAMGSPQAPTRDQIEELKHRAALPPPDKITLPSDGLSLAIPPNGIALLELS